MNRPLALTQRQIKAICEGARKAGYTPIIELGGARIRLVPADQADTPPEKPVDPEEEIEL